MGISNRDTHSLYSVEAVTIERSACACEKRRNKENGLLIMC